MFQRELSVIDRLHSALRHAVRTVEDDLAADWGLAVDQWRTLRRLSARHGRTMGELSESLDLPPATTTRLVDGLVDRGLCFRRPSTEDRRRVEVYLSASGEELLGPVEEFVRSRTDGLSVDIQVPGLN